MISLLQQLIQYSGEDYYPMHMPGHKRNKELMKTFDPYAIDITEIDGFDNLHHAQGIILDLSKRIEAMYHSEQSYLLVNGSTVGLLAGISACVNKGDRILMARNCHKSVYNAVVLNELNPIYVYPQMNSTYGITGGIVPEEIEELLITHTDIRLVVITSPTYEGIISDVGRISEICHSHGALLLVDEAHGAHLGFHSEFYKTSIMEGADLVIHSIHKTLPAFTQSAIMHVKGNDELKQRVATYLGIYETSSPSYVLLAGIDQCISLLESKGEELFCNYHKELVNFYRDMTCLKHLKVMQPLVEDAENQGKSAIKAIDMSKILISVKNTNITGKELASRLLEDYQIQLEMSSFEYALAMTSIADTKEGFCRLKRALIEIDASLCTSFHSKYAGFANRCINCRNEQSMSPAKAMHTKQEEIMLEQAEGRVAAAQIVIYPPGIPVVAAGEHISKQSIQLVMEALEANYEVLGVYKSEDDRTTIYAIRE